MDVIKANYRKLLMQWHPDTCKENIEQCKEMTRNVAAAYKIVMRYCKQYEFSFAEEEVKRYMSAEDWWFERFGRYPMWDEADKKR